VVGAHFSDLATSPDVAVDVGKVHEFASGRNDNPTTAASTTNIILSETFG